MLKFAAHEKSKWPSSLGDENTVGSKPYIFKKALEICNEDTPRLFATDYQNAELIKDRHKLEKTKTGHGIIAVQPIEKDSVVFVTGNNFIYFENSRAEEDRLFSIVTQQVGMVVEIDRRPLPKTKFYHILLEKDGNKQKDEHQCLAYFMNHSCNANMVMEEKQFSVLVSLEELHVVKMSYIRFTAARLIKAGEELTVDYYKWAGKSEKPQAGEFGTVPCMCTDGCPNFVYHCAPVEPIIPAVGDGIQLRRRKVVFSEYVKEEIFDGNESPQRVRKIRKVEGAGGDGGVAAGGDGGMAAGGAGGMAAGGDGGVAATDVIDLTADQPSFTNEEHDNRFQQYFEALQRVRQGARGVSASARDCEIVRNFESALPKTAKCMGDYV